MDLAVDIGKKWRLYTYTPLLVWWIKSRCCTGFSRPSFDEPEVDWKTRQHFVDIAI